MSEFRWTEATEKAAQLIALGDLTFAQIADSVEVSRQTLINWRQHDEFKARVEEHLAEIRAEVRRLGLSTIEARVTALNDRWLRMKRVIDARAADPSMRDVPGGPTGLLVRTIKRVVVEDENDGEGKKVRSSREVEEFAVDAPLLKELREHEKQAAQELGQWAEKRELTGSGGGPIQHAVMLYLPDNGRGSHDDADPAPGGPSGAMA